MISSGHLVYSYDGATRALDDVSLTVADGEFVCLLGGNGSGKATLAKHINALLVPDRGRVLVDGLDTADPEYVYDIRSTVGYVFQNPDDQLVATLVEDDVAFGPENLGEQPERIEHAVRDVAPRSFPRDPAPAVQFSVKLSLVLADRSAPAPPTSLAAGTVPPETVDAAKAEVTAQLAALWARCVQADCDLFLFRRTLFRHDRALYAQWKDRPLEDLPAYFTIEAESLR